MAYTNVRSEHGVTFLNLYAVVYDFKNMHVMVYAT